MHFFEGVYPPVFTAFDREDKFARQALEAFIDHLYGKGVHGLYVCGITGEGLMLSPEEREQVAEVAVAASRSRGTVMIHVGCGNTQDAVRLAKHAVRIGAKGVGCLAPYTNQYGIESLVRHYSAVAEAAKPLPVLIYYTPQIAPSLNNYRMLERILDLPSIAGVKFTGTDASDLACTIYERSSRQTVLCGVDEMFLATLQMGAHGAIGALANVVPELFVEIYNHAKGGRWREGNEAQHRLIKVIRVVERYPFLSALKTIARWEGYDCGAPRSPQLSLTLAEQTEMRQGLEAVGMRFPPGSKS